MVYQHGSPFYDEDEESCRVHAPEGIATVSQSAVCIRRISRPVHPGTGCLALRQKNIIRWKI